MHICINANEFPNFANFICIGLTNYCPISVLSLQCYCQGSCPNGQPNGTCEAPPGAGCFAAAEEVYDPETDSMVAERTYGCLPSEEGGLMMCRGSANMSLCLHLIWQNLSTDNVILLVLNHHLIGLFTVLLSTQLFP